MVFAHVHGAFSAHHQLLDLTPLRILWAGGEPVIFFFVLSGFVLSAPYCQEGRVPYARFIGTRLARIYIPYLAAIAACVLLSICLYNPAIANAHLLLRNMWPHPIDWHLLVRHALLVSNFNTDAYDEVVWSLVHEMRFAIIFPVFIWAVNKFSWKKCMGFCLAASLVVGIATVAQIDPSEGFRNSYLYSVHYLLFFMVGALFARNTLALAKFYRALGRNHKLVLVGIALAAYTYASLIFYSLPAAFGLSRVSLFGSFVADWFIGLGVSIFIMMALHDRSAASALTNRVLLFLGRISFSLYLVHVPVIATALYLFHGASDRLVVPFSLPFVLLMAVIFNRMIEESARRFGRRLFPSGDRLVTAAA